MDSEPPPSMHSPTPLLSSLHSSPPTRTDQRCTMIHQIVLETIGNHKASRKTGRHHEVTLIKTREIFLQLTESPSSFHDNSVRATYCKSATPVKQQQVGSNLALHQPLINLFAYLDHLYPHIKTNIGFFSFFHILWAINYF